jgi:hypothetical protein
MRETKSHTLPRGKVDHGIVYRRDDEFCGWVFTSGIWDTADGSILVGFKRNKNLYRGAGDVHHDNVTEEQKNEVMLIRSYDRGETWDESSLVKIWERSISEGDVLAQGPQDYCDEEPLDFTSKDVLVANGPVPVYGTPDTKCWVRVSTDGGRHWRRPLILPLTGLPALAGTSSSMVRQEDGRSLLFLAAISADGWTRRPVVYASLDGGTGWTFLSFITPKLDDGAADGDWKTSYRFGGHRWFYCTGIQLPNGKILCSVRCQRDPTGVMWTEIFESEDGARTWRFLSRVNDWGAPGDIVRMQDGRIACVYGYRVRPQGIRARISEDEGRTWGPELVLRDDGGSWDLGYPRVVERAPGELLAVYYFNTRDDPIQANGGVRHIARTIFRPD